MGLFDRFSGEERAIKNYVTLLPLQMKEDHGLRYEYTPAQVKQSAMRANLPKEYLALGYAMFLTRDVFESINHGQDNYDELRKKTGFQRVNEKSR